MRKQTQLPDNTSLERRSEHDRTLRTSYLGDHSREMFVAVGALGVLTIFALSDPPLRQQTILEATVRMENLAAVLKRAPTVQAETVRQISQLMQQPRYSCDYIACEDALYQRNHNARARLQAALSKKEPVDEVASWDLTPLARTGIITK